MVRARKELNLEIMTSNLDEAIEELVRIRANVSAGTVVEGQLQVWLCHAYHHLNFAWNIRHVSTEKYAHLTNAQFKRWGSYPRDIEG
jgi:hypothetical protein